METKNSKKLLLKGLVVVCTAVCMLVPVLMVSGVVDEREDLSDDVRNEIARSWGGRQVICAPEIRMPDPEKKSNDHTLETIPDDIEVDLQPVVRNEDYYTAELGRAYEMPSSYEVDVPLSFEQNLNIVYNDSVQDLNKDLNDLDKVILKIAGKEYPFSPVENGLQADIPAWMIKEGVPLEYMFNLKVKGIESIEFVPNRGQFSLRLESDYLSPGFSGAFLPVERTLNDSGFTAEWKINEMNMSDTQRYASRFGVDFVVPVSQYQQTARAIKYFFLIICLVFTGIFLVEAVSGKSVNIVQYIVTGFSLCLFYLLLLSFSEYMSFGLAYLIAAVLTTVSLGAYFIAILRSRIAYVFTFAMAVIYGFIYILLNMETGSLLAGSLALFLILCVIMYFTRNLNRGADSEPEKNLRTTNTPENN